MNVISVLRRYSARQIEPVSEVFVRLPTTPLYAIHMPTFFPAFHGRFRIAFSHHAATCNFQGKSSLVVHTTAVILLHRPAVTYTPSAAVTPLSRSNQVSISAQVLRPSSGAADCQSHQSPIRPAASTHASRPASSPWHRLQP